MAKIEQRVGADFAAHALERTPGPVQIVEGDEDAGVAEKHGRGAKTKD